MSEGQQTYRLEAPFAAGWASTGWIRVFNGIIIDTAPNLGRFFGRLLVNVEESVRQEGYKLVAEAPAPQSAANSD